MKYILILLLLPIFAGAQHEIHTDKYIEIGGTKHALFREATTAQLDSTTFQLIRGQDTLTRKVYRVQGSRYYLSCGDYIKVDVHPLTGQAIGLHYLEGRNYWYISRGIVTAKDSI